MDRIMSFLEEAFKYWATVDTYVYDLKLAERPEDEEAFWASAYFKPISADEAEMGAYGAKWRVRIERWNGN